MPPVKSWKYLRRPLIGICLIAMCGNAVPTSLKAFLERSDLVVEVVVTRVNQAHRLPHEPAFACLHAEVRRILKGHSGHEILICDPGIAESTPPMPKLGQRYRMYLRGTPHGFYLPFSYASFARLP